MRISFTNVKKQFFSVVQKITDDTIHSFSGLAQDVSYFEMSVDSHIISQLYYLFPGYLFL